MPTVTLREAKKNLTYNRLVDAAVDLLNNNAALTLTREEIARGAAVSRATVYSHFETKSDIMEAIAQRLYDSGREAYTELAGEKTWTRGALRLWLRQVEARHRGLVSHVRALSNAGPSSCLRESTVSIHREYVELLSADRKRWGKTPVADVRQRCLVAVLHVESVYTSLALGEFSQGIGRDPTELLLSTICYLLEPALVGE